MLVMVTDVGDKTCGTWELPKWPKMTVKEVGHVYGYAWVSLELG